MKKTTRGFTIVELAAVVGVLAVLATIVLIGYRGSQERARDTDRRNDVGNLTKALEQYYDDKGSYPNSNGGWWLSSDSTTWGTFGSQLTGIIDSMPTDPKNIGNPTPASGYGYSYAYYTGNGCGRTAGTWYMIVYRFENGQQQKFVDGTCATNNLGDTYYANGASYYISVK